MNIATKIKDIPNIRAIQALYKLSSPIVEDHEGNKYYYVIVSSTIVLGIPETYNFPSNEEGEITDWAELPGSQKNTLSHTQVLRDAGYEIQTDG